MNPGGGHPPPLPPPPPFMGDRGGGGGHHHHHHHHHPPQHPPPPPLPPLGHAHGSSHSHSGGGHPPHNHQHNGPPAKWHSFKLLVDPMIHEGAAKMIRYDGNIVPGNPHHISPTPTDPRKRLPSAMWKRLEPMELTVPRFKVRRLYIFFLT